MYFLKKIYAISAIFVGCISCGVSQCSLGVWLYAVLLMQYVGYVCCIL